MSSAINHKEQCPYIYIQVYIHGSSAKEGKVTLIQQMLLTSYIGRRRHWLLF